MTRGLCGRRHGDSTPGPVGSPSYDLGVARRPFCLKLLLIVASAAALAAHLIGLSPLWSVTIGLATPVVVVAAPAFVRGLVMGAATPAAGERVPAAVREMSGEEFEDYVALAARSCGIPVIMTPLTGDFGVDLVVGRRPDRLAVQCKRQARPVGAGAVQEVVAGAPMHDCTRTMVVTNHDFTPAARTLAERHGCLLISGTDLALLRTAIRRATAPTPLR